VDKRDVGEVGGEVLCRGEVDTGMCAGARVKLWGGKKEVKGVRDYLYRTAHVSLGGAFGL